MATSNTYRLDPTHIGLRLALLGIFFTAVIVGVFISIVLVENVAHVPNPYNIFAIPTLTSLIALGAGWTAEKILTQRWPSGKALEVTGEGLTMVNRSGENAAIRWDAHVNVMTWHFRIRKGRAWVPKGWYCVACQLKQDDTMIIPYAFIKPAVAEAMPGWNAFPELLPRKGGGKSSQQHQLNEIGEQAPLRYAEQDRWHFGAEMTPDDFVNLMAEVRQHVPDWQQPI